MIRINLIRGKRKRRKELNLGFLYLLLPLAVLGGLFLFHRTAVGRIETLKASVSNAEREIARLKNEIGEVEKFKARKAELQKKVDIIASLQTGRKGPVKVFAAISEAIPEKCWLEGMTLANDKVDLKGFAESNNTIAGFMTSLAQTGRFKDVVLGAAEQQAMRDKKVVRFNLTFQVVN